MLMAGTTNAAGGYRHDHLEAGSDVLSLTANGHAGARGNPRLRGELRPHTACSGRDQRDRRRSRVADLLRKWSARSRCRTPATSCIISAGTHAVPASVRMRRIRTPNAATSSCPACVRRASTSSIRRPTRAQPNDRPGPGATGSRGAVRLHPPAHDPLRAGGHLRRRPRQRARRGTRRRVPDGPRDLRHPRPLGNRPRAAAPRLRRMVAPRLRHHW